MRDARKRIAPFSSDVPQRQLGQADLATTLISALRLLERRRATVMALELGSSDSIGVRSNSGQATTA